MINRRQVEDRIKKLREARNVLHKLSKQSGPRNLSRNEQTELKKYDRWLSSACKELDKLSRSGENLLKMDGKTQKAMDMQESFNLQYLQLQRNMQHECRQFILVSNIMKVKHDTASGVIRNMR